MRFSDIAKTFASRGSLSVCLKDLEENEVVKRRVEAEEKPVKVYYSLTEKGRKLGFHISRINTIIREE
jgi:DNA-binding HxlR family transcriptional regulator